MTTPELKPCPFCGGTEIHIGPMDPLGAWECWEVGCNNDDCPLEADSVKVALGTPEKAAAAWNTRATDANLAALQAEIEALRAEVAETREFRDKMANAIGNDQLRRFIEKHGEPVPLTIRMQAAEARAERLAEALALLPDEIVMIEHNPYEGPLMFCCGQRVTLSWRHGLEPTHNKGCWYARMRAMRDHYQEDRND